MAELRSHWRVLHPGEWLKVRAWLGEVDEAVREAERVVERQERGDDDEADGGPGAA